MILRVRAEINFMCRFCPASYTNRKVSYFPVQIQLAKETNQSNGCSKPTRSISWRVGFCSLGIRADRADIGWQKTQRDEILFLLPRQFAIAQNCDLLSVKVLTHSPNFFTLRYHPHDSFFETHHTCPLSMKCRRQETIRLNIMQNIYQAGCIFIV